MKLVIIYDTRDVGDIFMIPCVVWMGVKGREVPCIVKGRGREQRRECTFVQSSNLGVTSSEKEPFMHIPRHISTIMSS